MTPSFKNERRCKKSQRVKNGHVNVTETLNNRFGLWKLLLTPTITIKSSPISFWSSMSIRWMRIRHPFQNSLRLRDKITSETRSRCFPQEWNLSPRHTHKLFVLEVYYVWHPNGSKQSEISNINLQVMVPVTFRLLNPQVLSPILENIWEIVTISTGQDYEGSTDQRLLRPYEQ